MIRINLLAVERDRGKKKAVTFGTGQKLTIGCSIILVLALSLIGWRYVVLGRESKQLDADIAAGAVGVGEISKAFGLNIQKADGTRLKVDDPALDPVWQAAARLDVPVFIHTAEPQAFFAPHDFHNERWLELALFPGRAATDTRGVTFEELVAERNRMFARNPKTRFIAAHFGWHANDLAKASAMLDAYPNVVTEVGAILYDIGRQPRAAHDFFVKSVSYTHLTLPTNREV